MKQIVIPIYKLSKANWYNTFVLDKKYQLNYAAGRPQMYDKNSREQKGVRIVKTLEDFLGKERIRKLRVLDVGASTGIIDNILSNYFREVLVTHIVKDQLNFSNKNL